MQVNSCSGFVLSSDERIVRRIAPLVFCPIMCGMCLIFWIEAITSNTFIHWLASTVFTVFFVLLLNNYRNTKIVDSLKYALADKHVTNICEHIEYKLSLEESIYITVVVRVFFYGKATKNKEFYLFSNQPFTTSVIKGEGLMLLKNLIEHKILVIPKTPDTLQWVNSEYKIANVPLYPKVACIPKRTLRTEDGSISCSF